MLGVFQKGLVGAEAQVAALFDQVVAKVHLVVEHVGGPVAKRPVRVVAKRPVAEVIGNFGGSVLGSHSQIRHLVNSIY